MRNPAIVVTTIFFVNILISAPCFPEEASKESKQFCEGVGPIYALDNEMPAPLLKVGSYRPILKNKKAMLILINDEHEKATGILVRTTKAKKVDAKNKKGQSDKIVETFFLDLRFYRIRLIEDSSDQAPLSWGEKSYSVQISYCGKKWHDVKEFSGQFHIFDNDASFILSLWDNATQNAADFFRGCLNNSPIYKSQYPTGNGNLGCMDGIFGSQYCGPFFSRCNDCSTTDPSEEFFNWMDNFDDSLGMDWENADVDQPDLVPIPCTKLAGLANTSGQPSRRAACRATKQALKTICKNASGGSQKKCCKYDTCKTTKGSGGFSVENRRGFINF